MIWNSRKFMASASALISVDARSASIFKHIVCDLGKETSVSL